MMKEALSLGDEEAVAEDDYYIPANVSARFELLKGYGMKELFINLAFLGAGILAALVLNWITGSIWVALVPPPVFGGIGFFAVFKDPRQGRSGLELFRDNRRYRAKQRRYLFFYGSGRD